MSNYPPIRNVSNNPSLVGQAEMLPDITYSTETGTELKLSILLPWANHNDPANHKSPLIVFVQGSAWTFPNIYYEVPQLSEYARKGYVVATVTHRDATKGNPFPAFLQDVKCAIRFLRKNAADYGIDPERVLIWGTSSGGNTAMLVGLTGDEERYETSEHAGYSDKVNAVVQCFGPTDIVAMVEGFVKLHPEIADDLNNIFYHLCGGSVLENMDICRELSPLYHVEKGKEMPPFLMLHGDADPVVPFEQGLSMYHALCDAGADVTMIQVNGAEHEGNFWSDELRGIISDFIEKHI